MIAKSFAFIYGRNQPNLGLLGIAITDESFYEIALDGVDIKVDLERCKITIGEREWHFKLSAMEIKLIETGGITGAFRQFGKKLFQVLCESGDSVEEQPLRGESTCESIKEIQW